MTVQLREMSDGDVGTVARLLAALAREFILHESAPATMSIFLNDNNEAALRRLVATGYVYHVADIGGEIGGVVGVREKKHLYHLFVAKHLHGKGIARLLWDHAKRVAVEQGGDGCFTVNSSNYAVGVYEALGFVRTGPRQCKNGLEYNPMAYRVSAPLLIGAA